ncbi:Amyloid Protein-Binding Protein 2 [Manis pentadactyla]|nr:Amyloid Protein-Binding Protein 2 [Manis pentadactyla]
MSIGTLKAKLKKFGFLLQGKNEMFPEVKTDVMKSVYKKKSDCVSLTPQIKIHVDKEILPFTLDWIPQGWHPSCDQYLRAQRKIRSLQNIQALDEWGPSHYLWRKLYHT